MKRLILLLSLFYSFAAYGQNAENVDLIVTTTGDSLRCKIVEITADQVQFRFSSGTIIAINKSEMASYKYNFTPALPVETTDNVQGKLNQKERKYRPELTTAAVTTFTATTATLGGNITSKGNPAYTERGVCYATSQNPTTAHHKTPIKGTGTGKFNAKLSDLTPNTTYYVRTYAIHSEGTAYGAQVKFKTSASGSFIEPEMVVVQRGTFVMGSPEGVGSANERPQHQVTLSNFSIGKYEVTQVEWVSIMGSNPSYFKGDNLPVETVGWNDIVGTAGASTVINGITYYENGFIFKLNQLSGKNYRLPTEAEWEYAARGGNQSKGYTYSGSDAVGAVAWYSANSSSGTKPAGAKDPNELDIYDMNGNVWEWCSDWYGSTYYSVSPPNNPTGPASGSNRVIRGGSWDDNAASCRIAYRGGNPVSRDRRMGFRLVLSL